MEEIKANIETEIRMASELSNFIEKYESSEDSGKKILNDVIESLKRRIRIINNSLPELVRESSSQKLPSEKEESGEKSVEPVKVNDEIKVIIKGDEKEDFLKELNISENLIRKLKKRKIIEEEKTEYRKPSYFGKISNKFFLKTSEKFIKKGDFKNLSLNLRRSNLGILTTTYVSMMFMGIAVSFFISILLAVFLLFFNIGFSFPFISFYEGNYLLRALKTSWVIIAIPVLTGLLFYVFPSAEKNALGKKIDQELPFVVIHMASVSGSGIEPYEIFKIIGTSKDYKYTGKEIKKVLNQTNIYGYDLSTALRNVAMATPSSKLSELLNGISITINSGGDIKTFFEKRADSLLLEYRLEREKFTKTAETFMDIYISIVIAAPMILLMLLVMIYVSGLQTGLGINEMTISIIGIVAIINVLFLTFLHFKQPSY